MAVTPSARLKKNVWHIHTQQHLQISKAIKYKDTYCWTIFNTWTVRINERSVSAWLRKFCLLTLNFDYNWVQICTTHYEIERKHSEYIARQMARSMIYIPYRISMLKTTTYSTSYNNFQNLRRWKLQPKKKTSRTK